MAKFEAYYRFRRSLNTFHLLTILNHKLLEHVHLLLKQGVLVVLRRGVQFDLPYFQIKFNIIIMKIIHYCLDEFIFEPATTCQYV
jgi:hypothetical protein